MEAIDLKKDGKNNVQRNAYNDLKTKNDRGMNGKIVHQIDGDPHQNRQPRARQYVFDLFPIAVIQQLLIRECVDKGVDDRCDHHCECDPEHSEPHRDQKACDPDHFFDDL